jgi:hypothetical protein
MTSSPKTFDLSIAPDHSGSFRQLTDQSTRKVIAPPPLFTFHASRFTPALRSLVRRRVSRFMSIKKAPIFIEAFLYA